MNKRIKFFVLVVSLLIAFMLVGCSENDGKIEKESQSNEGTVDVNDFETTVKETEKVAETTVKNDKEETEKDVDSVEEASVEKPTEGNYFDANAVVNGIEITEKYVYKDYGNYNLVLVLKNTVDDCDLKISIDFLDENEEIIGIEDEDVEAFAKGAEVAVVFSTNQIFSKYRYQFKVEECKYYHPVVKYLKGEVNIAKDKAIVSVTNNGVEKAGFVKYTALFFKGDQLVDTNWGYLGGFDGVEPGVTQRDEAMCYEDFDKVRVFLEGRSDLDW